MPGRDLRRRDFFFHASVKENPAASGPTPIFAVTPTWPVECRLPQATRPPRMNRKLRDYFQGGRAAGLVSQDQEPRTAHTPLCPPSVRGRTLAARIRSPAERSCPASNCPWQSCSPGWKGRGNSRGRTASILIARCLRPAAPANTGVLAFSNSNTTLTLTGNNDLANAGAILVTRRRPRPLPDPQAGTPARAVNQAGQLRPASPAIRDPSLLVRAVN